MSETAPRLAPRFKLAGLLVSAGLVVEVLTLFWAHPTSFLAFLALGAVLVAAGVLIYLVAIATFTAPASHA